MKIKRFADGEIYVQVLESIRGCDVFLIQPSCPPANDNLMVRGLWFCLIMRARDTRAPMASAVRSCFQVQLGH